MGWRGPVGAGHRGTWHRVTSTTPSAADDTAKEPSTGTATGQPRVQIPAEEHDSGTQGERQQGLQET